MAKDNTLKLSIQIAGKVDKSLLSAIGQTKSSVSSLSRSLNRIGTVGLAAMGAIATASVAAIVDCTNAAEEFEAQMGDVVKYVNGLADANGKISDSIDTETGRTYAENYNMMKDAILDLSTQIPYTAEELTKLAAAAGQSGKSINDLIQYDSNGNITGFLKDVAMWGTAMDVDAQQAGDWAAKWEKSFNMTHEEVMVLADQINYLGANSATTAAEIAQVVNGAASLGQVGGVDVKTTAALGDAMLAMGVNANRTTTSIKRMITNVSLGSSATDAMEGMWNKLGTTAEEVAKNMQEDSVGTLKSIFQSIKELPEEKQVAALKTLFGQWSIEGAAKVMQSLDTFTDALDMVNDPSLYTGSMEREFIIKASTAESIDQMMSSSWYALKVDIGDEFLPVKKQFATMMIDIINGIRKNMPQLEQLGESLAGILTKGVEKLGNALETALPYVQKALDYVANNGGKVTKIIGGMAATFAGMKAAPLIETLLKGGGGLLSGGISGIAGLVKGGQQTASLLANGVQQGIASNASGGTGILGTAGSGATGILATLQNWSGLTSGSSRRRNRTNSALSTLLQNQSQNGGLRGMLSSVLSNTSVGRMAGGVGSYFGSIGQSIKGIGQTRIGGAIGNAAGFVGRGVKNIGSTAVGTIGNAASYVAQTRPGQAVGRAASGIGNGIKGAAGFVGNIGSKVGGVLSSGIGAIGSFGGSILNVATTALGPITGMFGSILSGALPIIGVISSIIAVFSILGDNINDVKKVIYNVFGVKGLVVFDNLEAKVEGVFSFVDGILNGGLADALSGVREKFVGLFDGDAAKTAGTTFDNVVSIIQSVLGVVGQVVNFATGTVKPIIEEIFSFIVNTVLPIILDTFNAAAPTISEILTNIGSAVMTVAGIIGEAINFALPIIEGIITVVLTIGSVVIPAVLSAMNQGWKGICSIIDNIKGVFDGLIEFVTGVFTGNWQQAWDGVKKIFGNAFEALKTLLKTPMNAVISLINKAISGINSLGLDIPDWVPLIGGKKFHIGISEIPLLAKGGFTNGPSIAGEAGREAVISFDRSVRTQNIATWMKAGKLLGVGGTKQTALKKIDNSKGKTENEQITFAPTIIIQGNADKGVADEIVEELRALFEKWYDEKERRKKRVAY
jgi:TP901 family phage tail tape measure protein